MWHCWVMLLGISALHFPVSPCPPKKPKTIQYIECTTDSKEETRYVPGGRHSGLHCLLDHVAKSRSANEAEHVTLTEHLGYNLPCYPTPTILTYRYTHPKIAHERKRQYLPSGSSHWTKNGEVVDECPGGYVCRIAVDRRYLHIKFVTPDDKGLYLCTHITGCDYAIADTVEAPC